MTISEELDVSPWDALLTEVRRSAGRARWLDLRVSAAEREDAERHGVQDLIGETSGQLRAGLRDELARLLRESRAERRHLAVVSKAAIDAGVAERIVRQIEFEGRLVAAAIVAALDRLNLTAEQRADALATAHAKLLELEATVRDEDPTAEG